MRPILLVTAVICLQLLGCKPDSFHKLEIDNPIFRENIAFESFEDLSSIQFKDLKDKYKLDSLFIGNEDEFTRILILRDWIRSVISVSDFERSYPGDGYAEHIIDYALEGHGFHCGHYMIVQNAVMNAYGYTTRCLGAGPGVKVDDKDVLFSHHGVNEIWSNTYHKWFLSDAKYNHHFEKNGVPLSALDIRDEYLTNRAKDIVLVKGIDRRPIDFDWIINRNGENIKVTTDKFAQTYTWISWEAVNNRFTEWPDNINDLNMIILYQDDYARQNIWFRDGKPHWAYRTEYLRTVDDRDAIEWTPNTVSANTTIEGNVLRVELLSNVDNLGSYQMKVIENGEWRNTSSTVEIELDADRTEISFRAMNLAGVAGPPHRVIIEKQGK